MRIVGWIRADGNSPPPVGDCRKICWIVTADEMAYIGIRAYRHDLGEWTSNSQKESGCVTHWMDLPEPPTTLGHCDGQPHCNYGWRRHCICLCAKCAEAKKADH